jgi:hypothetical protein
MILSEFVERNLSKNCGDNCSYEQLKLAVPQARYGDVAAILRLYRESGRQIWLTAQRWKLPTAIESVIRYFCMHCNCSCGFSFGLGDMGA